MDSLIVIKESMPGCATRTGPRRCRGPSAVVTVIMKHGLVLIRPILALDTPTPAEGVASRRPGISSQYSGSCPAAAADDDDGCTEERQG